MGLYGAKTNLKCLAGIWGGWLVGATSVLAQAVPIDALTRQHERAVQDAMTIFLMPTG